MKKRILLSLLLSLLLLLLHTAACEPEEVPLVTIPEVDLSIEETGPEDPAAETEVPEDDAGIVSEDTTDTGSDLIITDEEERTLLAAEILRQINEVRAEAGSAPLTPDEELTPYADIRAAELPTLWSHTRPDGTRGLDILPSAIYPTRAENLGHYGIPYYDGDLESVADILVQGWVNSSSHYTAMVNDAYSRVGIGICHTVSEPYDHYYLCCLFTCEPSEEALAPDFAGEGP